MTTVKKRYRSLASSAFSARGGIVDLSIVIPAYKEERNIRPLVEGLRDTLDRLPHYFSKLGGNGLSKKYASYEIILIDDGSSDGTFREMEKVYKVYEHIRVIKFRKNFGQTAAMSAGFSHAKGRVVVSMDADLQNDPKDIPRLLWKLEQGYDVVSGWRRKRHDSLSKIIFSRFAAMLRRQLIGDKIHDYGCTLKAYRRECFEEVELFGEMHRYIPAILRWKGFKLAEIKVRHHPRRHGESKYDLWRLMKGFLDMLNVWFWRKFSSRPLHIFGGFGLLSGMFGTLCLGISAYLRLIHGVDLSDTFLPVVGVFAVLVGVQLFVSGILADIGIKNYFKGRQDYSIAKVLG
ncbi:MAG: glycosyltransferase family 2 protein [archaeon]